MGSWWRTLWRRVAFYIWERQRISGLYKNCKCNKTNAKRIIKCQRRRWSFCGDVANTIGPDAIPNNYLSALGRTGTIARSLSRSLLTPALNRDYFRHRTRDYDVSHTWFDLHGLGTVSDLRSVSISKMNSHVAPFRFVVKALWDLTLLHKARI